LAGGYGADPGHVAVALARREVGGDVAQVPRADARRRVFGGHAQHRDDELLAVREVVEDGFVHSGLSSRARGFASASSEIIASTTVWGSPSRSSTGPHRQPSRYESMSVEPSFIA